MSTQPQADLPLSAPDGFCRRLKKKVFRIVQSSDGYWPGQLFDGIIMVLIVASVLSVFAETFSLSDSTMATLERIELVISIVFSVEYFLRVWTADLLHPALSPWRARWEFVRSGMALVDLVAVLPFWLPMLLPSHLLGLRAIRLVRILRILKLNRYMEAIAAIGEVFRRKSRELAASFGFICLLMLLSSLLMYHAEHDVQPEDGHVVDEHVERALEDRGIDREHGHEPLLGHSGGHRDRVPLGDADVEKPVGELGREAVEARPLLHGGGYGADAPVFPRELGQLPSED